MIHLFTIQLYASEQFSFTIQPYPVVKGSDARMYPRAMIYTQYGFIITTCIRIKPPILDTDDTKITFDIVPKDGPARYYFELIQTGQVKGLEFKLHGKTLFYSGSYANTFEFILLDSFNPTKMTLEFFGRPGELLGP